MSVGSSTRWLRWGRVFKFGPTIELQFSIGEHSRRLPPAQCSRPSPAGSGHYVGSLVGWLFGGFGRMPGSDAGVALRAILRRVVVGCGFCEPSSGGVVGVGGVFNGVASLGACVQIRTIY